MKQSLLALLWFFSSPITGFIYQALDKYMTLGWEISGEYITFQFLCEASWCGIGLSNTMYLSDMYVAVGGGSSTIKASMLDLWSENHDTPKADSEYWNGEYSIIEQYGYYYPSNTTGSSGFINVIFKRLLDTGDIWDTVIIPGRKMKINWAYLRDSNNANAGFKEHSDYSQGTIKFTTRKEDASFSTEDSDHEGFGMHGLVMTVCWLILAPIGIAIARYCKHWRCWYFCHLILLGVAVAATIISVSLTYHAHETPYIQGTSKPRHHSRLGLCLTFLVVGQGVMGLICGFLQSKSSHFGLISQIRRIHKVTGYSMVIGGLLNNSYGWDIFSSASLYHAGLGIVLGIWALFEVRHQISYWWAGLLCRRTLPAMTHKEAMDMIVEKNAKIMFYDELVMNVKHFITSHPGGGFMLEDAIGEDAGKYLVGCSSTNGDLLPYAHSRPALDYTKKLAIARVPYPEGYLDATDSSGDNNHMNWKINFQQELNPSTKIISLSSPHFQMSQNIKEPFWIGKHFKVTAKIGGTLTSRYYSAFFADLHSWASELNLSSKFPECKKGSIQLIYRVYAKGKMTQHMHNQGDSGELQLKGPLGPGLMLNAYSGNYLGFAGGTGLIPFLDVAYLLWSTKDQPLPMSFTLFASFRTKEDSFCFDILEATSRALGEDKFKFIPVIDKQAKEMSFPDLVKKYAGMKASNAWICGPSGYNDFIKGLLIEGGLERNKIIVM
ncbi:unnamed protein product [Blepharisma stoltei]|uniref:Cytochrome b561 domain-containing protein n=1 Tax=Blepharisma stoltei TaxID=1481888 RepID=A0AAU9KDY5_9CILI|nr:unnamed protein product [Blepharisma stoltei]